MTILILIIIVAVALFFVYSAYEAQKTKDKVQRIFTEAESYLATIKEQPGLMPISTGFFLKPNEVAYWEGTTALHETRAVRSYQSSNVGFRIASGVRVGTSRGQSSNNQEWKRVATGKLCVTNQRLIFDGDTNDRTIPLTKIISINQMLDAVEVSSENRQKSMVYTTDNPLILGMILHICAKIPDPSNFRGVKLDIKLDRPPGLPAPNPTPKKRPLAPDYFGPYEKAQLEAEQKAKAKRK